MLWNDVYYYLWVKLLLVLFQSTPLKVNTVGSSSSSSSSSSPATLSRVDTLLLLPYLDFTAGPASSGSPRSSIAGTSGSSDGGALLQVFPVPPGLCFSAVQLGSSFSSSTSSSSIVLLTETRWYWRREQRETSDCVRAVLQARPPHPEAPGRGEGLPPQLFQVALNITQTLLLIVILLIIRMYLRMFLVFSDFSFTVFCATFFAALSSARACLSAALVSLSHTCWFSIIQTSLKTKAPW